jgi:hypothetical protein
MNYRLMVYDDFFMHPEEIRKKALEQKFILTGNFPGRRTDQIKVILPDMFNELETAVKPLIPANTKIELSYFQLCEKHDYRKIHQDIDSILTGIIYLNNHPVPNSGTSFYTHIKTGWDGTTPRPENIDELSALNEEDFEQTSVIENKFNRMIIYDGLAIHKIKGIGKERLTIAFRVYK